MFDHILAKHIGVNVRFIHLLLGGLVLAWSTSQAQAAIYVIDTSGLTTEPKAALLALGYTVDAGGTLADYSAYEQVWDLRYSQNITAGDAVAFTAYLQSGGRMYLTGEHTGFNTSRNNSLISFLNSVGAGTVTSTNSTYNGLQAITADGQIINPGGTYTHINYSAGLIVSESSPGFLVTETTPGSGAGSLIGWDFGDITGSESARMLVGFDINLSGRTTGGSLHTAVWGRFAQFLDDEAPTAAAVPEPATLALWGGLGFIGLLVARRQKQRMR